MHERLKMARSMALDTPPRNSGTIGDEPTKPNCCSAASFGRVFRVQQVVQLFAYTC